MPSVDSSSAPVGGACFQTMPPEVILKMMEEMTPSTLSNFVLSCKGVFEAFDEHKHSVMVKVLQGVPEFNTMLYLLTAHQEELHPDRMLRPRLIDFNAGSLVVNLMQSEIVPNPTKARFASMGIFPTRVSQRFVLKPRDLMALWNMVAVIDWWVELYPRLVWRDSHLDRRCLRASEEVRLRKAVARWWLYAHYHHGFTYHHRDFQEPKRWSDDTRLQQIRAMPTDEICELRDLWSVVKDTVGKDLCSSPERVCVCLGTDGVDLVPWGAEESRHTKIIDTYAKLAPEQLKYYLIHYSNWKRTETASTISQCTRDFRRDTETLSVSIEKVLEERIAIKGISNMVDIPVFGILDGAAMNSQHAAPWMNDAWPDGKVPLTQTQINAFPRDPSVSVARGDDGTDACCPY
ncbi:hypothetical protein F4781DRAFT_302200 [Annulohypoxylon bovei var. microspora]|nr:hypothetical protein F4781DRAFT_302200 [Annulohypoxylon bovei var. microspora]